MKLRIEGRLWHHRDFLRLWFGDTTSQFTAQVTQLALPTAAILLLGAGPFEMGILGTLQLLAFPTLGLFVGVWADRYRRRSIMIIANLGRMVTLGSIPIAFTLGLLSMPLLYVVGLITGVCTVFFDVSYQSYLPVLIDKADLVEGNSKLQLSASAGQVGGQALAGFLIDLVGAARAIAVDAGGFLVSALAILSIKKQEQKPESTADPHFFNEMKEGARVVLGSRILRNIAGCTATSNLGSSMFFVVFLIFAYRDLHLTPSLMGVIFSVGSAGVLFGAWVAGSAGKKLGLGRTIALSSMASIGLLIVPLALYFSPILILAVGQVVTGALVAIYNINQVSLRQAITPDRLQGRMNATMRTIVWGTIPLGSFLGGLLGGSIGIISTIVLGAMISILAVLWILPSPVFHLMSIPEQTQSS
jgi:MFS family permease